MTDMAVYEATRKFQVAMENHRQAREALHLAQELERSALAALDRAAIDLGKLFPDWPEIKMWRGA